MSGYYARMALGFVIVSKRVVLTRISGCFARGMGWFGGGIGSVCMFWGGYLLIIRGVELWRLVITCAKCKRTGQERVSCRVCRM